MIELINEKNIKSASEAFSSSWRFSHNGIVSEEILDEHSPEYMRSVILAETEKGNSVYTYMSGEESLGIISFSEEKNHISKLYVNAAYLRRGIGKQLILFAMERMDKNKDITVISLNVNCRARKFYESLGYVYTGEKIPFGEREDISQMIYVYKRVKN